MACALDALLNTKLSSTKILVHITNAQTVILELGIKEKYNIKDINMKIKLGENIKDPVTGFVGVVTARAEYMHRDPMILAEGIDSTGRPIEWWFDENRVNVI